MAETFGQFKARLSQLPIGANVADDTLDGYVNDTIELILDYHPWVHLQSSTVIQTPASYTTGTVNIANGVTTGVLTGGTWTSAMNGRRIRFVNRNEFYVFTFVDAANFSIDRPYEGPTNTAAAFKLWQAVYTLPSLVDFFQSIEVPRLELDLDQISQEYLDEIDPGRVLGLTDGPYAYALYPDTAAGLSQIELYPGPEIQEGLPARYRAGVARFTDTDSQTLLPTWIRSSVLFSGCEMMLYQAKGDTANKESKKIEFLDRLKNMATMDNQRIVPMPMVMAARYTQHRIDRATGSDSLRWQRWQLM
jgi:hypothetical protein